MVRSMATSETGDVVANGSAQRWVVGAARITSIVEDQTDGIPPALFFPAADAATVRRHGWLRPRFADGDGNVGLRVQAFVVEVAEQVIVVDPCVGNGKVREQPWWNEQTWPFMQRFRAAGFDPDTVDLVVHTHLHADHVGWDTHLVDGRWVPTFPQARHVYVGAEIDEVFEARLALEEAAVELAPDRLEEPHIGQLRALVERERGGNIGDHRELHQLVAGASTILGDLSGGAYTLAVDARSGGFGVVDHTNASQVRSARTLSGGETFLASLALALALADQVAGLAAEGTARLESLFLDEGFGTLDADTLDVVATALDELGARGRMVGVVTHVRELADRLPVRFEVRKIGGSSAVERVEA